MAELAPGFYVDDLVPAGKALRFQAGLFFGHAGPVLAMHPTDWDRIPGADRERLLDNLTRNTAKRGINELQAMLQEALDHA